MLVSKIVEKYFFEKKRSIYTKMVEEELKDTNQTNLMIFFLLEITCSKSLLWGSGTMRVNAEASDFLFSLF